MITAINKRKNEIAEVLGSLVCFRKSPIFALFLWCWYHCNCDASINALKQILNTLFLSMKEFIPSPSDVYLINNKFCVLFTPFLLLFFCICIPFLVKRNTIFSGLFQLYQLYQLFHRPCTAIFCISSGVWPSWFIAMLSLVRGCIQHLSWLSYSSKSVTGILPSLEEGL